MNKIRIITDSACDIPVKTKLKNTEILGFYITIDGKSYEERKDFTNKEFYRILEDCTEIPATAHITMMRFGERIEYYYKKGVEDIIIVTINGSGSATYNAAIMAKDMFFEENPDAKIHIHIIDSQCYSIGYGYPVMVADEMVENGVEAQEIVDFLIESFENRQILLATYSLRFMKKSGRISRRASFAGEMLGLKPIILMDHGKTSVLKKVRGDKMVIPGLIDTFKQLSGDYKNYIIAYTDEEYGKELYSACKKELGAAPLMSVELGCAVSANAGNHCVGIVFTGNK